MTEIRPARTGDAPRVSELLAQLGYPSDLDAVIARIAGIQSSTVQRLLVAAESEEASIDGFIGVERRLGLQYGERVEIVSLVVDSAARRSGIGHSLVGAAEQWTLEHGLHTIVVRSNVARLESHPFYEGVGYRRTATSHVYGKDV